MHHYCKEMLSTRKKMMKKENDKKKTQPEIVLSTSATMSTKYALREVQSGDYLQITKEGCKVEFRT